MKKVKRESVRKIDFDVEAPSNSRFRLGNGGKKSDPEFSKNTSASKSYRITTADNQRLVASPSMSKAQRSSVYDPSLRKLSGASDFMKQTSRPSSPRSVQNDSDHGRQSFQWELRA